MAVPGTWNLEQGLDKPASWLLLQGGQAHSRPFTSPGSPVTGPWVWALM